MAKLNIIIKGKLRPYTNVMIDNQVLKFKKIKIKKQKVHEATIETQKDKVELSVKAYYHLHTKFWFFKEMFFFLISIFGIFDVRFNKNSYFTNCKVEISTENPEVTLKLVPPLNNKEVVKFENESGINIIENTYVIDKVSKKRNKILKTSKILTIILALVIAIVLII